MLHPGAEWAICSRRTIFNGCSSISHWCACRGRFALLGCSRRQMQTVCEGHDEIRYQATTTGGHDTVQRECGRYLRCSARRMRDDEAEWMRYWPTSSHLTLCRRKGCRRRGCVVERTGASPDAASWRRSASMTLRAQGKVPLQHCELLFHAVGTRKIWSIAF